MPLIAYTDTHDRLAALAALTVSPKRQPLGRHLRCQSHHFPTLQGAECLRATRAAAAGAPHRALGPRLEASGAGPRGGGSGPPPVAPGRVPGLGAGAPSHGAGLE